MTAKVSENNIGKFIELNEGHKNNFVNYTLSEVKESRPAIENSIGIVIMMILISDASITNFFIEDEEQLTKTLVLVSGIS